MSILITGAAGQLGRLVIDELLKKVPAVNIVACVRNLRKAADIKARGLELRYADYDDCDSMKKSFAGADKLLFISSPDYDNTKRVVQHATAFLAAREAGVKHLLYTSFAFVERSKMPFAPVHFASELAIRTTGLPYTFLRNSLYADEAFVNATLKVAVASGELVSNCRQAKINAVSRPDLAKATAAVLAGAGHENKIYNLVSDSLWDYAELARVLSEVSGKKIAYRPVSAEEETKSLVALGMPANAAGFIALMYERVAEGDAAEAAPDLVRLIGKTTPLKELVALALQS